MGTAAGIRSDNRLQKQPEVDKNSPSCRKAVLGGKSFFDVVGRCDVGNNENSSN